jgi:hypothetical protein
VKQLLRAASIGFGGTLGVGAAVVLGGALVAVLTRSALTRSVNELVEHVLGMVASPPDQTHPYEPCGAAFGGGQGPCILDASHAGQHTDHIPA